MSRVECLVDFDIFFIGCFVLFEREMKNHLLPVFMVIMEKSIIVVRNKACEESH